MRPLYALIVIGWLTQTAIGQVSANPTTVLPTETATQDSQTAKPTPAQVKSKKDLEGVLDELFKKERQLAERGRIWAKTKDQWTDIRIVEGDLDKASKHYAAGARHWEAGRYADWLQEMNQVRDVLERARPQLQRIEWMIHAHGGSAHVGSTQRTLNSMVPKPSDSKKRARP